MNTLFRWLCFAFALTIPLAHAWNRPEMAKYGAAYRGAELLSVHIAHNKADDHAVVKISGVNHPLDGRVLWTKVVYTRGTQDKVQLSYVDESIKDADARPALFIEDSAGAASATLILPNYRGHARAEIPLRYDEEASEETLPEHLLTDYERQIGVAK